MNKVVFEQSINKLYAAFNRRCSSATLEAVFEMLGSDASECTDDFIADAVDQLMLRKRLPDNVGSAILELWKAWRVTTMRPDDTAMEHVCRHCGGRGWITVFCSSRPGVAPAMVRCVCNGEPKLSGLPAYTRATAASISCGALDNPWVVPGARDAWLVAHTADGATESNVPNGSGDTPENADGAY